MLYYVVVAVSAAIGAIVLLVFTCIGCVLIVLNSGHVTQDGLNVWDTDGRLLPKLLVLSLPGYLGSLEGRVQQSLFPLPS